jgi:hypothetical protein
MHDFYLAFRSPSVSDESCVRSDRYEALKGARKNQLISQLSLQGKDILFGTRKDEETGPDENGAGVNTYRVYYLLFKTRFAGLDVFSLITAAAAGQPQYQYLTI